MVNISKNLLILFMAAEACLGYPIIFDVFLVIIFAILAGIIDNSKYKYILDKYVIPLCENTVIPWFFAIFALILTIIVI